MQRTLTHDPFDILLKHNRWATREVLLRCRSLSTEQFHRAFPIGLGSLHATLTHTISAMRRWSDRVTGRAVRPSLERAPAWFTEITEGRDRTPDELLTLLDQATDDLAGALADARKRGFDRILDVRLPSPEGPTPCTLNAAGALVHALTHGRYHLAQCMNMLRHLDVPGVSDSLPDLDASEWQHLADGAAR